MPKRIIFSNATPNDKDGIIPNDVIDFSRFNKNPVVLSEHIWATDPLGMWTDIKMEGGNWTGVPIFHGLTEESKIKQRLYEGGWLRAASIGGFAVWKENAAGQYVLDGNGNKICVKFFLYEVSLVTLPSNEDAVQMDPLALMAAYPEKFASKLYEKNELVQIENSITTLSSKFQNTNTMTPEEIEAKRLKDEKEKKEKEAAEKLATILSANPQVREARATLERVEREAAEKLAAEKPEHTILKTDGEHTTLKTSLLPKFITELFGAFKAATAPTPENLPKVEPASDAPLHQEQNTPIGLKGKEEKEAMEKCATELAAAIASANSAKAEAEKEGATETVKTSYAAAFTKANECMAAYEAAEAAYKAKMDSEDGDEDDMKAKKVKEKNSATKQADKTPKPVMKTKEQLKADLLLAAPPTRAKVGNPSNGRTFTQLAADKKEGQAILNRVMCSDAGEKNLQDYATVLNSIMNDGRLKAVRDNMRIVLGADPNQLGAPQDDPANRRGISIRAIAAQLNAGSVDILDRSTNQMKQMTTLSSTDNALASPALNTIEWLPLAIFQLFPTTSWKNEIPMFGAQMTGKNTGIIWANVAAAPAVYKGAQPATNQAIYTYGDTAVAMSLTPYWLQPMQWTPLTMHQLRYDMMGTGWAQAFSLLNATIDDELLYTLASTVPASSIVQSSGLSGYQTNPLQLTVAPGGVNQFYWNPAFNGNLIAPTLNDIIAIEQIYRTQNFQLEQQKAVLVMDPIMEASFSRDPESKSLLTRWINADGADLLAFKNTVLNQRSRVAIFDPATGQVKDPAGVIPGTSVSAGLSFIPSQVGIGLGMLDVFFQQNPQAYGYIMSADLRMGIAALRANFNGTALYTYANGNV